MSVNQEELTGVPQLAYATLPHPADMLSYCPAYDLVAFSIPAERCLAVYRLNGERAFSVPIVEKDSRINHIAWRDDGQILALASSPSSRSTSEEQPTSASPNPASTNSELVVRLVDVFGGKVVHKFNFSGLSRPEPFSSQTGLTPRVVNVYTRKVSCLGWSMSVRHLDPQTGTIYPTLPQIALLGGMDLPREFMMWDTEKTLPKVSTLQPTGGDDDVFSTRASIDAIFNPLVRDLIIREEEQLQGPSYADESINVLLVGFDDGTVHLRIFDSFQIGSISLTSALPADIASSAQTIQPVRYVTSRGIAMHILVVEVISRDGHASVHLISIGLGFLFSGHTTPVQLAPMALPLHLPVLITKTTQLQNLQKYLAQAQWQLEREVQNAFDLPGRWLGNICETLAESESPTSSQQTTAPTPTPGDKLAKGKALFEAHVTALIATGECEAKLREWMVDELGERAIKRWEKAVVDGLELLRRGLEECVLPALERCLLVLSRLMGFVLSSHAASAGQGFGLDEHVLHKIIGLVNAMILIAHDAMKAVTVESQGFRKYINWLRWCTEIEQCETEERREEIRDGGAEGVDWQGILEHVRGGLKGGKLASLLGSGNSKDSVPKQLDEVRFYDEFRKARREGKQIPGLGDLMSQMWPLCERVFEGIAENLRGTVRIAYSGEMKDGEAATVAGRIFQNETTGKLNAVFVSKFKSSEMHLTRTLLRWDREKVSWQTEEVIRSDARLGTDDLKLVDADRLLRLHKGTMLYIWHLQDPEIYDWYQLDEIQRPGILAMAVNGRIGRSVVCLLRNGGRAFEVLDLENTIDGLPSDGLPSP